MDSLFNDSEVFTNKRPSTLSEKQKQAIYKQLAQEILDNDWSSSDISDIIIDISKLSLHDSGYELAKRLESWHSKADYDIDTEFIEWLDMFSYNFDKVVDANEKQWVKAYSIKPKYPNGSKLVINQQFSRAPELACGNVIYVNGHDEGRAKYYVNPTMDSKSNTVVNYEVIEANCELLNNYLHVRLHKQGKANGCRQSVEQRKKP